MAKRSIRLMLFFAAQLVGMLAVPAAVAAPPMPGSVNLTLFINDATINGTPPAQAFAPGDLQHGCEFRPDLFDPIITISPGGTLNGSCNFSRTATPQYNWDETWTGSYTGTVESSGRVTFEHTAVHTMVEPQTNFTMTYSVSFQGVSQFHDSTGSSNPTGGTYTFSRVCSPGTSSCLPEYTMSYSGTVGFNMSYTALTNLDARIDHMEVVQVIQTASNSVPLVADKPTVVRVFLISPVEVPLISLTLKARRNGVLLTDTPEYMTGGVSIVPSTFTRSIKSSSVNFQLPWSWLAAGEIELEATLVHGGTSDPNAANNTLKQTFSFQTRKPLHIGQYVICHDQPRNCSYDQSFSTPYLIEHLFPLPWGGLVYRNLPVPYMYVDPARLASVASAEDVLRDLEKFAVLHNLRGPVGVDEMIVAYTPPIPELGGLASPTWAGGKSLAALVVWDPTSPAYNMIAFAHEVAHNLGAHHPGTPDSCGSVDSGLNWPYSTATIQEVGWDQRTDEVVQPSVHDLMSYCPAQTFTAHISPYHFAKLFLANSAAPASLDVPRAYTNYTVVSGTVKADASGGAFDPVESLGTFNAALPSNPAGTHCIRINDTPSLDYCFTPNFSGPDGQPLTEKGFVAAVPFTGLLSTLKLCEAPCGPSDTIMTKTASANWPFFDFITPATGTLSGPNATISWSATDADPGSTLTYTVYQSTNGGPSLVPLIVDTTETSFTFDASQVGQGASYFTIVASDGMKSNSSGTGLITVGTARPWGDVLCNGALGLDDVLAIRRDVAGLDGGVPIPPGCPAVGNPARLDIMPTTTAGMDITWGALRCGATPTAADVLDLLKVIAGLPVAAGAGSCPDIGEPVYAGS